MTSAALVVASGLQRCEGIPAAMYKVGAVSSAQNMIASFQKAGVSPIFLAVDESTRKLEKQLGPEGVLLLQCEGSALDCAKQAISALPGSWDRLFVCTADRALVLPKTIEHMLSVQGDIVVPTRKGVQAQFFLLSDAAVKKLCREGEGRSIARAVSELGMEKICFETDDTGLFSAPKKAASDKQQLERHQTALMRPRLDITIFGEQLLVDRRLVELLRQLEILHSVRAACEMTGISYSVAWNLLNSVEDQLGYQIVSRNQGGRSGRGTELTEKGRRLLEAYNGFEAELNEKMTILYKECFQSML